MQGGGTYGFLAIGRGGVLTIGRGCKATGCGATSAAAKHGRIGGPGAGSLSSSPKPFKAVSSGGWYRGAQC